MKKSVALTLVGPMKLQSLDKSTGRHLRRSIDSVVVGPKATLTVYEHRMFKGRWRAEEDRRHRPS